MMPGSTTTRHGRRGQANAASILTVLALLVGGMVAVAPTAGAQAKSTARDVPLLKSDPAPRVGPEREPGDFTNPPAHPSQADAPGSARPSAYDPDRSVVVDAETTPTKKVVTNRDGSRTAIVATKPVRFQDAAGWRDIDLNLVPGPGGTLSAKAAPGAARLAPRAEGIVASIDTPAGPIGLRHPESTPAPATVEKARAAYKGALGGRDLLLSLTVDGFEETVVLPDAASGNAYLDEFVLPAGVTARDAEVGVEFLDADGVVVAIFSNGVAFDSAPGPNRAAASVSVRVLPATTPAGVPSASSTVSAPTTVAPTTVPASSTTSSEAPGAASPTTSTTAPTTTAPTTTATTVAGAPANAAENVATVEVSVERAWLADSARVFPVTIDPTVTVATGNPNYHNFGIDTMVWENEPITNYGGGSGLYVGSLSGGRTESFIKFYNLAVTPAPDVYVTESHLLLFGGAAMICATPVNVHSIDATLNAATVWNNRPAAQGPLVSTTALAPGCDTAWNAFDTTSLARRWLTDGAPNNGLRISATDPVDPYGFKWFYSGDTSAYPLLYITYAKVPGFSNPVVPATGSVVNTATPTLGASTTTDPDGDVVKYWFRATPAPDATSGAKSIDSGWLTATPAGTACAAGQICYRAPVGALAEGVTYHWQMITGDGAGYRLNPATPFTFRIDLGLGARGAQPRDAIGPAVVNLASGNVLVGAASPSFATVNGSVGLGYAYNSLAPPALGLTGSYYNDPPGNNHVFPPPGSNAAMVRTDPTIDHYWGAEGPGLGVPANNFLVRWTGFITAPAGGSGQYRFTADHDDGMRITVGTTLILDHWSDGAVWNPSEQAAPINLVAGAPTPITVDYYQNGGAAFATLAVVEPNGHYGQLPPSWLSPNSGVTSPELSAGWTLAPGPLSYVSAVLGDRWVGFMDASGAMHTYSWTGSGYAPPPGDDGVVGVDDSGALTLHATDGVDYVFDRAGRLTSATSALDDGGPGSVSSMTYTWSGTKPRLTKITDSATGREILLAYGTGSAGPSGGPCASGAPKDFLCEVVYWDATATKFSYAVSGPANTPQLARIEDPGAVVTDFAYSAAAGGRLVSVRSPLANDAVAAATVTGRTNDATVLTQVAYEAAPTPRATSVTLPAPLSGAERPAHSYTYASATETRVSVAGLTQPLGFARRATFARAPSGGLTVVDTDADDVKSTAVYDAGDRLLSADAAGRRSTATYDTDAPRAQPSGRVTNTYGPAPIGCFGGDNRPNGACATPPPHTATSHDTDPFTASALTGLAATYWPNRTLGASPANHADVVPVAGSLVPVDPPAGLPAGSWSGRYRGEISLDQTGSYGFAVALTGRARVFIDDRLVVDAWSAHATTTTTVAGAFVNAVAGRHRIRVDYATQADAPPGLTLRWTPPGGTSAAIPTAKLAPRYSTPTASVSADTTAGATSRSGDARYLGMANGLVTEATADRGGANIVTRATYETAGSGYLRPKTRVLGAGSGSTTTYDYYAAAQAAATPCAGAAANQAKALWTTTGATPATGAALVHTFAYDLAGRVVGSAVAGTWSCTAYDARGRVASLTVPPYGGEPARTFTSNYAVGANPLVSSVSDGATTMTSAVDLLGRTVSYRDVWNKTTTSTYDRPGRRTATAGPAGAVHVGYSPAGRVDTQSLDGALMADAAYNLTTGELASVSYPSVLNGGNGTSLSAIARHPTGSTTGLTWRVLLTGAALATDAVVRSQSGRVVDETIDGTDADPANPNFAYDSVGRLTKARIAGRVLDYGFATSGGCGPQAAPGRNSNRSSLTDTAAGSSATTGYCYDNADRLVSSTDAAVGAPAYDSHGNTTTLGAQSLVYDGAGRHMETKVNGTSLVRYERDATGRITSRKEGAAAPVHYGFSGPGDSPSFVMDANNNVIERTIGLVGGVMVTKRGLLLGVGDVWSYPNIHGDVMATADQSGVKLGATRTYDPFGQGEPPDNSAGNFDYGWLGQHQRPSEHAGTLATIEMGARQYVPSIGRFLQADPVEGGSANDYEYCAGDPVNCTDLAGEKAYSYTYDLGRTGTPEELLSYAISNCSRAFPISGCTSGFQEGDELDLRKSFGIYVQSFPVRVTNITATSFSLVARDGHPEGRGRTITFTFYKEPGSFRNKLRVSTSRKGSALVNWWGLSNGNFWVAKNTWNSFANNIRSGSGR